MMEIYKEFKQRLTYERARHFNALARLERTEAHWRYLHKHTPDIFHLIDRVYRQCSLVLKVKSQNMESVHLILDPIATRVASLSNPLRRIYTLPEIGEVVVESIETEKGEV